MSVDDNFTMIGRLAVSIAYLERRFDVEYAEWLAANTIDEWVSE